MEAFAPPIYCIIDRALLQGLDVVIAPLTWVRLVTSSALQSQKWQLIGMS